MDNNEIYVNEVIGAYLDTKEEMKDLDEVTVKAYSELVLNLLIQSYHVLR